MRLVINGEEMYVPDPDPEITVNATMPDSYMKLARLVCPLATDGEIIFGVFVEWMLKMGIIELELEGTGPRQYDPDYLRKVSGIPDPWNG